MPCLHRWVAMCYLEQMKQTNSDCVWFQDDTLHNRCQHGSFPRILSGKKDNDAFYMLLDYVPHTWLSGYGLVVVHALGADVAGDLPWNLSKRLASYTRKLTVILLKAASLIKREVKSEALLFDSLLLESFFCDVGIPAKRPPYLQMPGAA